MYQFSSSLSINTAVLLVFATIFAIGYFVHWLIPSIPLAAAFALIAALGPTDDVAVAAVAHRVSVPSKIMSILSGESIINDASGIVSFQFAIAAVMTGTFSLAHAAGRFVVLGIGGVLAGLLLTWIKYGLVRWIRGLGMENVTLHLLIGIVTPFAVYMIAEALELSGILAVFAAGIAHSFLREQFNPETVNLNIASDSLWDVLSFSFDGLVFIILGTQLPGILSTLKSGAFPIGIGQIIVYVLLINLGFILIRFLWWVVSVPQKAYQDAEYPVGKKKAGIIFALAGARGTVTLASVMSIPFVLADGTAFPERDLIILLSVGVIICSLIITNFILPLWVKSKTSCGQSDGEINVAIEIMHKVITQLSNEITPENQEAAKVAVRSYYSRSASLARRKNMTGLEQTRERNLRLDILNWEKENVRQMLLNNEIDSAVAGHYMDVIDARTSQLNTGAKKNALHSFLWWLKHLKKMGRSKRHRQNAFMAINKANSVMVLKKLNLMREDDSSAVLEKLIAEYEIACAFWEDGGPGGDEPGTAADGPMVLDMVKKGFQLERNLILQMYEAGHISREKAKEMRVNIATLEAQLQ